MNCFELHGNSRPIELTHAASVLFPFLGEFVERVLDAEANQPFRFFNDRGSVSVSVTTSGNASRGIGLRLTRQALKLVF